MNSILAVNAGSSSLKLALFDADDPGLPRIAHETFGDLDEDESRRASALGAIDEWCRRHSGGRDVAAAGHRVVHGGTSYAEPVVVTERVLADLDALAVLAPLHQPHSLAPVHRLREVHPALVQVACFDTAFHRGRPSAVERYGLPEWMFAGGVRRYGFHGLSYEYVLSELGRIAPEAAAGRVVVAHLGSGASLCAIGGGHCVDTSMGFSTLSGLVMSTRCGDVDPGVVLHLLRGGVRSVEDVERLLYRESGLRGISGISGDLRDLLASNAPAAREAVDCFVVRIVREIGALTAMLGGLDALVFTAGIGEHSAEIRARVCRDSAWSGLVLDEAANANASGNVGISADGSAVSAWVVPTDEERMIARHVRAVLRREAV